VILAGDLGGTKTALALYDDGRITRDHLFRCADYGSLEAILDAFMPERIALVGACIGVAGPVVDGVAHITNLPWTIDARALTKKLGAPVSLLNDLQTTALGALALPGAAFATLQAQAAPAPTGTIAVVAPGTGFGEAIVFHDGTR
jgi:glucokinase